MWSNDGGMDGGGSVQHLLIHAWFYFLHLPSVGKSHILVFFLAGVAAVAVVGAVVGVFVYQKREGE